MEEEDTMATRETHKRRVPKERGGGGGPVVGKDAATEEGTQVWGKRNGMEIGLGEKNKGEKKEVEKKMQKKQMRIKIFSSI